MIMQFNTLFSSVLKEFMSHGWSLSDSKAMSFKTDLSPSSQSYLNRVGQCSYADFHVIFFLTRYHIMILQSWHLFHWRFLLFRQMRFSFLQTVNNFHIFAKIPVRYEYLLELAKPNKQTNPPQNPEHSTNTVKHVWNGKKRVPSKQIITLEEGWVKNLSKHKKSLHFWKCFQ